MVKHPHYDAEKYPFIFLKDSKFVSIVDVKRRKVLPLVRSQLDLEQLNVNNLAIRVMDDLNRSITGFKNLRLFNEEENKNNADTPLDSTRTWIYTLECKKESTGIFRSDLKRYHLDVSKINEVMDNTDWRNLATNLKAPRD